MEGETFERQTYTKEYELYSVRLIRSLAGPKYQLDRKSTLRSVPNWTLDPCRFAVGLVILSRRMRASSL